MEFGSADPHSKRKCQPRQARMAPNPNNLRRRTVSPATAENAQDEGRSYKPPVPAWHRIGPRTIPADPEADEHDPGDPVVEIERCLTDSDKGGGKHEQSDGPDGHKPRSSEHCYD